MTNLNLIGDKVMATRWIPEANRLLKVLEMCITDPGTGVKGLSRTYHDGTTIVVAQIGELKTINIRSSRVAKGQMEWKLLYRAWDNPIYTTDLPAVPNIQWIEGLKETLGPDAAWADISLVSQYPSIMSNTMGQFDITLAYDVPVDEWYHAGQGYAGWGWWYVPFPNVGSSVYQVYPILRDAWIRRIGTMNTRSFYNRIYGQSNAVFDEYESEADYTVTIAGLYSTRPEGHPQLDVQPQPDATGYDSPELGHVNWIPLFARGSTENNAYACLHWPILDERDRNASAVKDDSEFIHYYSHYHDDHAFYMEPYTDVHTISLSCYASDPGTGAPWGFTPGVPSSQYSIGPSSVAFIDAWAQGEFAEASQIMYCPTHAHHCAGVNRRVDYHQVCKHPTYGNIDTIISSATQGMTGTYDGMISLGDWGGEMLFPQRADIYDRSGLLNSSGKAEDQDVIVTSYYLGQVYGGMGDVDPHFTGTLSTVTHEYWSADHHVSRTVPAINGFGFHPLKEFGGNMYYGGFGWMIAAMVETEK